MMIHLRTFARLIALIALVGLAYPTWSSDAAVAQTFGGNDCTDDCSGHAAGYRWAEENGIEDSLSCSTNSQSFNEGCETFLAEPYRGADEDDDGNEIEE